MTNTSRDAPESAEVSVFDLRKQARARAWVCPGGGFALFGNRDAAMITYALGLAATASAFYTVLMPSRTSAGILIVLLVLSTIMWIAEIVATYVAWPRSPEGEQSSLYLLGAVVLWSTFILLAATGLATYAMLEVGGQGMSPILHEKDKLLYRRRVDSDRLQVGNVVLFRLGPENKFTGAGTLMFGRIMAVPGDKLSRREGSYYVNDVIDRNVVPNDPYPLAMEIARYPQTTTVPESCYFVIQDSPDGGLDSRVLSWAKLGDIVSTELYLVRGLPPWKAVE